MGFASAPGVETRGEGGLTGVPGALPRPFVGAAPSPSSVSPYGVEARSWSPVSEARGWQGQPGECPIRAAKSPNSCSSCNPPCSLSCSRIFHGSHLLCHTYSHIQCQASLAPEWEADARGLTLPPSPSRMKRAMSLNTLNVDGPKAAGAQVRGAGAPRTRME